MDRLKICLVSSEVSPFAKTGGLADVASALSRELHAAGVDVRVFMPLYQAVRDAGWELEPVARLQDVELRPGGRLYSFSVSKVRMPGSELDVHVVRCPELFAHRGIYTEDRDEHMRFALLSLAALRSCQFLQWAPDVVHCNDWHTGLLPLYLRTVFAWDQLFARTRTLLTIHNIGYQGNFPAAVVDELGLAGERGYLHQEDLRAGTISFLKTGLLYADALSTVSRTYAREIQTEEMGMGLAPILRSRSDHLFGIVNGVDYGEWSPETDPHLPHNYSARQLDGKRRNRRALLAELELHADDSIPLVGIVSRLTSQKGLELCGMALPPFLERNQIRLAVLGSGDPQYEADFRRLAAAFPGRATFRAGYDEALAHRIEAGSDLFVMPSRYEPCGLNQMYSLRYGTVPIVRRTGGLADTVEPFDPATRTGTGFLFDRFDPRELMAALAAALETFRDRAAWRALMQNGMSRDFSWRHQVGEYLALYRRLAAG